MLQQGVVAGQATITCAAQEKLFPNRAALCHFYVDAADFDREHRLLERLTPGPGAPSKHVPGEVLFHIRSLQSQGTLLEVAFGQ